MCPCVNLRERFGKHYRITFDEAAEGRDDPWMMQIPCTGRGITLYPHGGTLLAVEVDGRWHLARRLREMGLTVHQDGDREQTFLFDVADFDRVAEVVQPRKSRRLTEEQKARLLASQTPEERAAALARAQASRKIVAQPRISPRADVPATPTGPNPVRG